MDVFRIGVDSGSIRAMCPAFSAQFSLSACQMDPSQTFPFVIGNGKDVVQWQREEAGFTGETASRSAIADHCKRERH
jgi:hypothetical protein